MNVYIQMRKYLPLVLSNAITSSLLLVVGKSNDINVPNPRTAFTKPEYCFSNSNSPFIKTFPVILTFSSKESRFMIFIISSKRIILLGSPIQVLKIRYGCFGLKFIEILYNYFI